MDHARGGAPDAIVFGADRAGVVTAWPNRVSGLLGVSAAEVVGESLYDVAGLELTRGGVLQILSTVESDAWTCEKDIVNGLGRRSRYRISAVLCRPVVGASHKADIVVAAVPLPPPPPSPLRILSCSTGESWKRPKRVAPAVGELLAEDGVNADTVDLIELEMTEHGYKHVGFRYVPGNAVTGQFSIEYCVAAYVLEGVVFVEQFRDELLDDPRILDIVGRIKTSTDPTLEDK